MEKETPLKTTVEEQPDLERGEESGVKRKTFSPAKRRKHGFVPLSGRIEDFGEMILFDLDI